MKVIYDITLLTLLGSVRLDERNRTGIFRVIESLARALAASRECDLTFTSTYDRQEATEYWRSDTRLRKTPFLYWNLKAKVAEATFRLDARINSMPPSPKWNLAARGLRNLVWRTNRYSTALAEEAILEIYRSADIYHSPFGPFPEEVQQADNRQRFVTVYDLTPISHPQFYPPGADQQTRSVLASVKAEDWVICISESCRADLCNYTDVAPSQTFVTPLAADPDLFYCCSDAETKRVVREKYGIPEAPYILSLCTLQPRKNLDHLIRCYGRLLKQEHLQDLYLVLAGARGWLEGKIFDEITRLGSLSSRVIVTGYVADEDLAPLYGDALAFVYPSFYEGFGLPPLEAMQCGVPVITSNTSSLPEVVGDAGIMLDPTDADGLCHSLLELHRTPSLREAMSLKSRERAREFSWARCASETIQAYRTALSNSAAGAPARGSA